MATTRKQTSPALGEYDKKRNFARTREPRGAGAEPSEGSLRFVVQKHAARRLHYDFRLELDGTLLSWAVPQGPSLDPGVKRLAVHVEDHPIDYATFEGVIADGNYGAGQVIVWDAGVYSPDDGGAFSFGDRDQAQERMRQGLEKGKLSFTVRGQKLLGSWTLVRTARSPKDWLLIKHRDAHAEAARDVLEDGRSVQSGLTLQELKSGRLPDPAAPGVSDLAARAQAIGVAKPFPSNLRPMLAHIAVSPFSHPEWLFEPKLDGFRALAFIRSGKATLASRNGLDMSSTFPEIAGALAELPVDDAVLDGELVALDDQGRPHFATLQEVFQAGHKRLPSQRSPALGYYVFDLLYLDGHSLEAAPLSARKVLLAKVVAPSDLVQLVEYVEDDGETFFQAAKQLGLEGMVAKKKESRYESGGRSRSWLKIKFALEQDFVVIGYTEGQGSRSDTFAALLLGYYEGGLLRYAGRVGTGFDQRLLRLVRKALDDLPATESPFDEAVDLDGAVPHWVGPHLVAKVRFSQWTDDGRLRAPVFVGLRHDLDAREIVREETIGSPGFWEVPAGPADPSPKGDMLGLLDQLSGKQDKLVLEVSGNRVSLTNLNKQLWPASDGAPPVTKRDLIRYYLRMSPVLLPHLKDRPITLTRYPDGVLGKSFYQKHWAQNRPEFVETVPIFSSHNEGDGDYILVNNLATLVWLAQLANIELHPWLSRVTTQPDALRLGTNFAGSEEAIESSVLNYPDFVVFDLDPYIRSGTEKPGEEPKLNPKAFSKAVEVAYSLKEVLDQLSLSSFLKTSGKTGLHIYVPVLRQYNYTVTRKACELISRFVLAQRPNEVTMEWSVAKRGAKIFMDHNQNTRSKNMAAIYSLRPSTGATVSMPVRWEELEGVYPPDFNISSAPERVEKLGDLWADILQAKHNLSRLLESA